MRSTHLLDGQLEVQIVGEFGETGSFPVAIPAKVAGSLKLTEVRIILLRSMFHNTD